jgi:hypothetical protein
MGIHIPSLARRMETGEKRKKMNNKIESNLFFDVIG